MRQQSDTTSVLNGKHGCNRHPDQPDFRIIQRVKTALTNSSLKPSERCLLSHLMLAAGQVGETTWAQEKLETAVGLSERQIRRVTRKLECAGMIRSIQRGLRKTNRYLLPWHPEFSDRTSMSDQEPPDRTPMSGLDRTPVTALDRTSTSGPIVKDSCVKDFLGKDKSTSSSSFVENVQVEADRTTTDEDVAGSSPSPWWERFTVPEPNPEPDEVVEPATMLLTVAKRSLMGSRCSSAGKPVKPPDADLKIVRQICSLFETHDDFEEWVATTERKKLADKAKTSGYGLWLKDANDYAEALKASDRAQARHEDAEITHLFASYTELTGKTLSDTDKRAIVAFRRQAPDLDAFSVKAGIAATLVRTLPEYNEGEAQPTVIRSVKYFFPEIQRVMDSISTPESRQGYGEHAARKYLRYAKKMPPERAHAAA